MDEQTLIKVLLIEDNPGDARLTCALLEEASFGRFEVSVLPRLDAATALLREGETAFDVVLLDLSLPDASGLTGVREIQQARPGIPIVVLTGLNDPETSTRAVQAGAQDFLVKGEGDGNLISRAIRYSIERKRAQALLVSEKERAELANRSKSEFLANMSHELRTPLNAIIGFAELICEELKGPVGAPCYKEYATDIRDSGVHLLNIINDLLDLSKIEAGKAELREGTVEIARVFESCITLVMERAKEGNVTLAQGSYGELPRVRADSRMIKQVVLNLVTNAVKFTPPGGRVTLEARHEADGRVAIAVIDTGIGIKKEDIPQALSPFAQIDNSLDRRFEGTGLGLPLANSLMALHGGTLRIDSTPGLGTRVTVHLPAHRVLENAA